MERSGHGDTEPAMQSLLCWCEWLRVWDSGAHISNVTHTLLNYIYIHTFWVYKFTKKTTTATTTTTTVARDDHDGGIASWCTVCVDASVIYTELSDYYYYVRTRNHWPIVNELWRTTAMGVGDYIYIAYFVHNTPLHSSNIRAHKHSRTGSVIGFLEWKYKIEQCGRTGSRALCIENSSYCTAQSIDNKTHPANRKHTHMQTVHLCFSLSVSVSADGQEEARID